MDYTQEIERLRDEEKRLHNELAKTSITSDNYKTIQNELSVIHRLIKEYAEIIVSDDKRKTEDRKVTLTHMENRKKLIVDICLGVAGLIVPMVFNCYWLSNGFKFEETGSFSSRTFQWLINNQFKKK